MPSSSNHSCQASGLEVHCSNTMSASSLALARGLSGRMSGAQTGTTSSPKSSMQVAPGHDP
ncbi:hypothetical protein D3C80_1771920 [compost metagenome]